MALYDYDEDIRHLIYQLKGCKDVALAPIFLDPFRLALRIMFWGYTMVPAPSWHEDDAERGFNHVEEIFRSLGLKTVKILRKTSPLKQADLHQTERAQVHTRIALDKSVIKIPRKVLFVDDVLTTGSTARAACDLLRETGVHKIRILVIAKTLNNEEKQRASSAVDGIARK